MMTVCADERKTVSVILIQFRRRAVSVYSVGFFFSFLLYFPTDELHPIVGPGCNNLATVFFRGLLKQQGGFKKEKPDSKEGEKKKTQ
jgi:hypothetical protein